MRGGYQNFNIFVRVCMDRRFLTPASSAICEHTAARRVTVRPAGVPCAACTVCVDEVKFLDRRKTNISKFAKGVFINQERKLEVRRRLDTALVLTVNMSSSDPPTLTQRLGGQLPGNQRFWTPGGLFLDSVGGGAWPFLVGGAICLVNSGNERDSSLLNRRRHSGVRGVRVARLTGGVIKIFLEGPAASSRTRLSNNRGPGNPLKLLRAGDWGLQLSPINEEFLVSASHKLALITSLPFVHTARRYYRLNDLVRSSDRHAVALSAVGVAGKLTKLDHLEEDTFEHRHFERTLRSVETHPGPLLSEGRPYITKGHIANALALSRARVPFDN
ncbi:hypothetical protein EVAR_47607_1 [Eumeta japonica]|uniref:Uncharacterized protein n=1 Tax=Eumeta variegata TaxID=151549 RepID=A0A4C1WQY2_EUMVA|nr:hypothetical protein EVAR_47607_1 [Eumeta japonica]